MVAHTGSGMAEYLAYIHAVTFDFGFQGRSVSKIKYYVNPIE
ncbi:hypothetical protein OXPF_07510 [Oxobacter pfennigii]|uniref:Uncharacterized protein n=1 Tax=Oxobacter pfennigii TaxID=36849 RepID=A0A0P9AJC3_9CLOT|nr:hypothetical protein [Oxobacter pfennigii]KPU45518.1 hypothetical protein OXPF_07510 [Oxobacter pfennigii]